MNYIRIEFNKMTGILDLECGHVYFYHFVYNDICTAVKNLEYDVYNYKQEIEFFDKLLNNLFEN